MTQMFIRLLNSSLGSPYAELGLVVSWMHRQKPDTARQRIRSQELRTKKLNVEGKQFGTPEANNKY